MFCTLIPLSSSLQNVLIDHFLLLKDIADSKLKKIELLMCTEKNIEESLCFALIKYLRLNTKS
jgi:hypothetical protein